MANRERCIRVLFVCLGNICRSPTAEGVFRSKVAQAGLAEHILIDSCGTGDWHVGQPPDPGARRAAADRGLSLDDLRARQLDDSDFERFDWILAMDSANLRDIKRRSPPHARARIALFLPFAPRLDVTDVPDPYGEGNEAFDQVYALVDQASDAFLNELQRMAPWQA
ncbi:low molecular weight protein-tyrosine-phosphatase [Larsenimonas rhizosphaerae]|uniref:protein-tyrosine-phosphatase n=1 Tax=Larsenimonas rhizosphaerae TaxID=2944682 RepID=A0AA41ZKX9_9GAMM|nr:low molecular weight protein-tyrosine-phosphatase [Larsenimonas rhizosphaerae]MCX2523678.1 low molecular weight phosphotyrosine protein phosphatase [Larsenimonas rhizosphaerae]